jgi:hypothetical protein
MRRMDFTLRLLPAILFLCLSFSSIAQTKAQSQINNNNCKPPKHRELWHDYIDREQTNALKVDGKADGIFFAGGNEDVNYFVTEALTKKVDNIQCELEKDTSLGDQRKKGYLKGLEVTLRNFIVNYRNRSFSASVFPTVLDTYFAAIQLDKKSQSIERLVSKTSYEVGNMIMASGAFDKNTGAVQARQNLTLKFLHQHPEQTFVTLAKNPNFPLRDSLIIMAGYKYPNKLYDYAAANNSLGNAIQRIDEPFIKAISRIARSGSGQLYLPFIDNIVAGKVKIEDIDAVKDDNAKYYKLLVATRIDYLNRVMNGEKVQGIDDLTKMLEKRARFVFINEINALHNEPDAKRFKVLEQFNAQELYYMIVSGESEMYTSSYIRGLYPRVMQRIGNKGDSLLMSVGFDRFKKFIKVAAGYNTISEFLSSMDKEKAQALMTAFVNNLERSQGLEDGVDVADSYASIAETMKPVAAEMLKNVKINYEKNVQDNNKRGMVIYNVLYKLFLSADSASNIDLTKEFGIPPVYSVSNNSLSVDSSGRIVMQVFFFGDDDGKNIYSGFLNQFSNGAWKRVDNKQWVQFNSTKGKPVSVFANKWFPEESGEDEKAQEALTQYLVEKGLSPTIVVHRGHSYYAESTIEHIQPSARIVFLGSCGGYHLIHEVLERSGDAHIIASKQIGRTVINKPFFDVLNDRIVAGKNIDWVNFWNDFKTKAGKEEGFEDYIPPHKNLGAIFIKAYNGAMGGEVL